LSIFRRQKAVLPAFRPATPYHVATYASSGQFETYPDDFAASVLGMGVAELWRTQPYLRTVVSFMARNVAQLGLHTFLRVSDTDRRRLVDHQVALLFGRPNSATTSYELIYQLVSDLALYDRAYWLLSPDAEAAAHFSLTRIPPAWVQSYTGGDLFAPGGFVIVPTVGYQTPGPGVPVTVPADRVLYFHGWNPEDPRTGSTPVDALKQILSEQIHAQRYREQVWRRGGRVGSVLSRPADAPAWSDPAKERFKAEWQSQWADDTGADAGGTPILEDGMTLNRLSFSAHEDEYVDAAKLALGVVASVYHVNPTMIGQLDNANYSNVREFRRMLYGDSLGPVLAQIEDRVNTFLVPRLDDSAGVYVEFNISEKLQGNFEEQASALQTAVGRPWMTADEARGRMNLPAMGGDADALVTPLNVLVGGQASPTDSGSQNLAAASSVRLKARVPDVYDAKATEALQRYFRRQSTVVQSRLGLKADADWWDEEGWNDELSAELYGLSDHVSRMTGVATVTHLGFGPNDYDPSRTVHYLRKVSRTNATNINATTRQQVADALDGTDPEADVESVFTTDSRALTIAASVVTFASAFGSVEGATQVAGDRATKTWITGENPRESHAAMDGESVPIDEVFSNGLAWPGDGGDPDEVAGCNCEVEITV
jgi:HK97 family phage portal protein